MADALPPIGLDYRAGAPHVIVGEQSAGDYDALLTLAPALSDPHWIRVRAQAVNHLAHGYDYDVILDPGAFKEAYLEEYDAEDPEAHPLPGQRNLRGFGVPQFDAIEAPKLEGDTLVFFATETYLGIPYRVVAKPGEAPVYMPVPMGAER